MHLGDLAYARLALHGHRGLGIQRREREYRARCELGRDAAPDSVSPTARTQISGSVSVSNFPAFPATQNVNVTGGTVTTTPSVATTGISRHISLDAGGSGITSFTAINASYVDIRTVFGDIDVTISGPLGVVWRLEMGDDENHPLFFTQRIPVSTITSSCNNAVLNCAATVYIFGD